MATTGDPLRAVAARRVDGSEEGQVLAKLPVCDGLEEPLPLGSLHREVLGDEVGADRLDERGVRLELVQRLAQVRRGAYGRLGHVEPVAALGRTGVRLVLDAEQGRLHHCGQRDVDGRRAVAEAVLEPRTGAALRRDAHRRTTVVDSPSCASTPTAGRA